MSNGERHLGGACLSDGLMQEELFALDYSEIVRKLRISHDTFGIFSTDPRFTSSSI